MATERGSGPGPGAGPRQCRARDTDRSRVYEAEGLVRRLLDRAVEFPTVQVAGSTLTLPVERRFGDVAAVQRYVAGVLALPTVGDRWPARADVPVVVRERRGATQAHYEYSGAVIAVPTAMQDPSGTAWAMRESVVLHEVAHHLLGDHDTGHGPAFRSALLDLVDAVVGPELRLLLLVTYADVGLAAGSSSGRKR